jgi:hypothetical protein
VSGKTIRFTIDGTSAGDAVTDGSGLATLADVDLAGLNAGLYVGGVAASFSGDSTYAESSGTAILTVNPMALTIIADDQNKTYGDGDPVFTYQVTSGFLVDGDTFSGTLARAAGESAGTYAIQQGTLTAGSNYDLAFIEGTLSITARALTVIADDQSKVYGTEDPVLTFQLTSGSLVDGDTFSGTLARAAGESAGTYAIQQGTLTAGGNYDLAFIDGTLNIAARALTVTTDDQTKAYGDDEPVLTFQITSGSLVDGDSFSGALARVAGESVGTYAIQQGTLTAGANYDLTCVEGTFVITPVLKTSITGGGSLNISNNGPYEIGEKIQLAAVPSEGWVFSGWSGDLSGANNPATITMDGNKVITAAFVWVGDGGGGNVGGGEDEEDGDEEDKEADSDLPEGTDDVTEMVTPEGRFISTVTEVSPDNVCALTIPTDTLGVDKDLKPLTMISIMPVPAPPSAPATQSVIGLPYNLKPEGTTFDRPVTITLTYDPANIPAGINEQDLILAFYDNTNQCWVNLNDIRVDKLTRTISGKINHFAIFSVIGYTHPAAFVVSALIVSPEETAIGGSVCISINIANTGDLTGCYDATLKINDIPVETRRLTISGCAGKNVVFRVSTNMAGTYTASMDNLTATFFVQGAPPEPNVTAALAPMLVLNPAPVVIPTPDETLTSAASFAPAPSATQLSSTTPAPDQVQTNWDLILGLVTAALIIIVILIHLP